MGQRIVQVDAFTDEPFAGNPAGVCLLERPRDDAWMQAVAREMNLSETAFLLPLGGGAEDFRLRWFTPSTEVDLCGHATLASAHVLFQDGHVPPDRPVSFLTRSGRLAASRGTSGGDKGWITLDFPAKPPEAVARVPQGLLEALGVRGPVGSTRPGARVAAGPPGAPVVYVGFDGSDYLVHLGSPGGEAAVRAMRPDFGVLMRVKARGVMVTAEADSGAPGSGRAAAAGPAAPAVGSSYDFVSRFFAPNVGVPEDPVTGSSHCCLGPYWAGRLGRDAVVGRQVSARGGTVRVRLGGPRVLISGQAVTVLRAELLEG